MSEIFRKLLPDPLPQSEAELLTALQEIIQSIALLGLWRAKFFENAAFYGGTALRLLYDLDRFSEDLDFSLLSPSDSFSFETFTSALQKEVNSFGLKLDFELIKKKSVSPVESAFLKGNTYTQLLLIEAPEHIIANINKKSSIKVKLEVDTNPPGNFNTEMKYIFTPVQFAVRSYTLPCLFAGKMHALLFRRWKNRIKGRDWYDFVWYASNYPVLDLKHLEARMRQTGNYMSDQPLTKSLFKKLVLDVIDNLDVGLAKNEVMPFVPDTRSLDIWSKDFFKSAVEKIEFL